MLTETAPPTITEAMRGEISRHMRLSTGFAADQDEDLAAAFRAAVAHLEASLGLCLAPRGFRWRTTPDTDLDADPDGALAAPIAPVRSLISASRIGRDGAATPLDLSLFTLDQGATRTRICARSSVRGAFEFEFEAGFGADWEATPADLRRAALMLAAHYFDNRHETAATAEATPYGVAALTQPWRPLRIGLGGRP